MCCSCQSWQGGRFSIFLSKPQLAPAAPGSGSTGNPSLLSLETNPSAFRDASTPQLIPLPGDVQRPASSCRGSVSARSTPMQLDHDHRSGEGSLRLNPLPSNAPSSNLPTPSAPTDKDSSPSPSRDPVSPTSITTISGRHETTPALNSQAECPSTVAPVSDPGIPDNPQSSGAGLDPGDIEMESVTPSGHRRRRSSLINPANSASSRSQRPRSQSILGPVDDDEGKIPEESSDDDPLRLNEVDEDGLSDEDLHDDEETGLTGKDRRRKRRKRNRNQLLDQRIVRDSISQEEKKEADRSVAKQLLINGALIGLWYFFSLCISLVRALRIPSPCSLNTLLTYLPVQQMDVLTRQTQFPVSHVYNLHALPRAIFPSVISIVPFPVITATPQIRPGPVKA